MGLLLGISQGNISHMEHGKRSIGKQIAKKLAALFKTD
jgi:transcriptional regulator with XRE-family HTH domain